MGTCEICGNSDDKAFSVSVAGAAVHTFDRAHCGCRILGHGVEADWTMDGCA